jgi:hypothetical protein
MVCVVSIAFRRLTLKVLALGCWGSLHCGLKLPVQIFSSCHRSPFCFIFNQYIFVTCVQLVLHLLLWKICNYTYSVGVYWSCDGMCFFLCRRSVMWITKMDRERPILRVHQAKRGIWENMHEPHTSAGNGYWVLRIMQMIWCSDVGSF